MPGRVALGVKARTRLPSPAGQDPGNEEAFIIPIGHLAIQFGVGQRIGVDPTWVVALQAVGGAAGNMICVHNVVAASAVVGMLGREGLVIRRTFFPFVYYALLTGTVGYFLL